MYVHVQGQDVHVDECVISSSGLLTQLQEASAGALAAQHTVPLDVPLYAFQAWCSGPGAVHETQHVLDVIQVRGNATTGQSRLTAAPV